MADGNRFSGVLVPALTPFDQALKPDAARLLAHCRWLLDHGAAGLAVFGTTSEANSLSVQERKSLLEALIRGGVDPALLMPGTGCCALSDTVDLTRHAVAAGCGGVLMLPPFYYKGVSDDGLFAAYAETIERVGDKRLRIYLYHIPQVSGVPLGLDLVERLFKTYPGTVVGLKDSSGDWDNTHALLTRLPDLATFAGSEAFLLATLKAGGPGCISAMANVHLTAIKQLFDRWQDADADALQESLKQARTQFAAFPMIPALKAAVAGFRGDPGWRQCRPPLRALGEAQARTLAASLNAAGLTLDAPLTVEAAE
ncbi:MAG: dihydrodipicolinate synthase family protein [Inquilinaceae bacterium]